MHTLQARAKLSAEDRPPPPILTLEPQESKKDALEEDLADELHESDIRSDEVRVGVLLKAFSLNQHSSVILP